MTRAQGRHCLERYRDKKWVLKRPEIVVVVVVVVVAVVVSIVVGLLT